MIQPIESLLMPYTIVDVSDVCTIREAAWLQIFAWPRRIRHPDLWFDGRWIE